jgi:hypothetical protein
VSGGRYQRLLVHLFINGGEIGRVLDTLHRLDTEGSREPVAVGAVPKPR